MYRFAFSWFGSKGQGPIQGVRQGIGSTFESRHQGRPTHQTPGRQRHRQHAATILTADKYFADLIGDLDHALAYRFRHARYNIGQELHFVLRIGVADFHQPKPVQKSEVLTQYPLIQARLVTGTSTIAGSNQTEFWMGGEHSPCLRYG